MLLGAVLVFYKLLLCTIVTSENYSVKWSRIKRAAKPPYRLTPDENSILHERCGDLPRWRGVSDKAIGGIATTTREAPWSVSLQYTDDAGNNFICSGTLISDKHVLTAAHCVIQFEMRADAAGAQKIVEIIREPGSFKFSFDDDCGKHYARNCVMRPLFTRFGLRAYIPKGFRLERSDMSIYDIAVFEMDEKIDINKRDYVIPACLQALFVNDDDVFWMFGYGSSSYDPNVSNSGPLLSSSTTAVDCIKNGEKRLGGDNFCTKSNQHPCRGDSGAGLIRNVSTNFAVVGVQSSSRKLCFARNNTDDYVDVNVSVYSHGDWICEYTGICMSRLGINRPDAYKGGVDIIEDPYTQNRIKYCGDEESWIYDEINGKKYCYKTMIFKQRTTVYGAKELCKGIDTVIAPVRYAKEFGAIKLSMTAAQVRRRPDHRILVGGEVDETGINYKWNYDGSPVSTEITTWVPGKGPGNKFTPASRCVTLQWYDPLNAGAPPSRLGFSDIACESKDAAGVVCMKTPAS